MPRPEALKSSVPTTDIMGGDPHAEDRREVYVPGSTGSAGFEPPERAEVQVDFPETELDVAVERTLELLGFIKPADDPSYSDEEERQVVRRLQSFGYL